MKDESSGDRHPVTRQPKTLGELDEAARDMARETGWGYERCMVALQRSDRAAIALAQGGDRSDRAAIALAQGVAALGTWFHETWVPFVAGLSEAYMETARQILALAEQLQPPAAKPRLCPTHGREMRGGTCQVCARRGMRATARP